MTGRIGSGSRAGWRFVAAALVWVVLIVTIPVQYLVLKVGLYFSAWSFFFLAFLVVLWLWLNRYAGTNPEAVRRYASSRTVPLAHIVAISASRYLFFRLPSIPFVNIGFVLYFFCWAYFRLLLNAVGGDKPSRRCVFYVLFLAATVLTAVFLNYPEQVWVGAFAPVILVFEVFYFLKLHRRLRRVYFFLVNFIDLAVPGALVLTLPGVGVKDSIVLYVLSFAGFAAVSLVSLAARRSFSGATGFACTLAVFFLAVSVLNSSFQKLRACDYERIGRDFLVHSRRGGAYDMVLDPGGRYLYAIFGDGENSVDRIDTTGVRETGSFGLSRKAQPQRLIHDAARNRVLVAVWGAPEMTLLVLDAGSLESVRIFRDGRIPKGPVDITMGREGRYFYLLGETAGEIVKMNAETLEPVAWGEAFQNVAYSVSFNPVRRSVFVSSWIFPSMSELTEGGLTGKKKVRSPFVTYELESDPFTGDLFAANPAGGRIDVYDGEDLRLRRRYETGFWVRDFQVVPERNLLVAGSYVQGVLDVIDLTTGKRLGRWRPESHIRGVYYDAGSGRVFAACRCGIVELKKRFRKRIAP
ncbi:MAG: hypothetical protein AB1742_08055 [bacterium]